MGGHGRTWEDKGKIGGHRRTWEGRALEDMGRTWGGRGRTWEDTGAHGKVKHWRTLEDMGGPRRTWEDMGGHGRTWEDIGGHGRTWEDMENPLLARHNTQHMFECPDKQPNSVNSRIQVLQACRGEQCGWQNTMPQH